VSQCGEETGHSCRPQRAGNNQFTECGPSRLLLVQLLLMQKTIACAAGYIRQCSEFHQTGHSIRSEPVESKPPIRCARVQQTSRGTKQSFILQMHQELWLFNLAATNCGHSQNFQGGQ
jgi:hypothetical protein